MNYKMILISLTVLLIYIPALAQTPERRPRRGPPPEAVQACKQLKMGDRCSFVSPHGKLSGSCWRPNDNLPLACRPDGHRQPPPRQKEHDHE